MEPNSLTSVSRLSRKCGILDVPWHYRPLGFLQEQFYFFKFHVIRNFILCCEPILSNILQ
jgi:hypothetical protein